MLSSTRSSMANGLLRPSLGCWPGLMARPRFPFPTQEQTTQDLLARKAIQTRTGFSLQRRKTPKLGAELLGSREDPQKSITVTDHAFYFSSDFPLFSHNWRIFPTLVTFFLDPL